MTNTPPTNTFTRTITHHCNITEIPPRCRKPRPIPHTLTHTVTVPDLTTTDAPVAFTVDDPLETSPIIIREYNGQLYTPMSPRHGRDHPILADSADYPAETTLGRSDPDAYNRTFDSEQDAAATATILTDSHGIIVDGRVHIPAAEPCYRLSRNRFIACISVDYANNTFQLRDDYFRADDFDGALAHAVALAADPRQGGQRARKNLAEHADSFRRITVHRPDAVRLTGPAPTPPHIQNLRQDYDTARSRLRDARTAGAENDAYRQVADLRQQITDAGYAPVDTREEIRPQANR
jgi:hypothetical protein